MASTNKKFTTSALAGLELSYLEWTPAEVAAEHAPLVVLLHGGGANAHWWDHIAPSLAIGRRVVALDFRGHGDSDFPSERHVGAFNDDLEAFLDHLGRHDVVLIGHSMGAHVALDHASRFPATRGLVLIDLSRGASKRSRRSARLALAFRRTYPTREEAIERYRFLPPSPRASEALRRSIAAHSVRVEEDGRFGFKFDPGWFGLPSKPKPDLARIACPTLLVRGAESDLLSEEGARAFEAELPTARLAVIAEAGHHVQLDQPEALIRELDRFLSDLA